MKLADDQMRLKLIIELIVPAQAHNMQFIDFFSTTHGLVVIHAGDNSADSMIMSKLHHTSGKGWIQI